MIKKEKKIELLNLRKNLVTLALGTSMLASLTGCKDNINETNSVSDTEITTEVINNEVVETEYSSLATSSYNKYKEFYDAIGVKEENVEKLVRIINDDLDGITEDDIYDAVALIEEVNYSENMSDLIQNYNFNNNVENYPIYDQPRTSDFISDENIELKRLIVQFENQRDELYNAYASKDSNLIELANQNCIKLVKYSEDSFDNQEDLLKGELQDEALKILLVNTKLNMIKMTCKSTNLIEVENNGYTIYLTIPVSIKIDENGNEIYDFSDQDAVAFAPEDSYEYQQAYQKWAGARYNEMQCHEIDKLVTKTNNNNNVLSYEIK